MSLPIARSLTRVLSRGRALHVGSRTFQSLTAPQCLTQRGFTRSLWYLGSSRKPEQFAKPCGCCGLHTEGDKEFSEFLKEEIKYEQLSAKATSQASSIKGFEVTKSDGAEIVLTKKIEGETIKVSFNVNNSVDNDMDLDESEEQSENTDQELVSRPVMNIEINRGGDKTFHIQCSFLPPEMQEPTGEGEDLPLDLEIQEVCITNAGAEWGPTDYVVSGSNMDGNMYDMILNMLEERGMGTEFAAELEKFATSYEHKQYVNFLGTLKDFLSC